MKRHVQALNPVFAALVLGACSTSPTMPENAWKIAPVQMVRHGGASAAGYFALGRYHEGRRATDKAIDAYRKALDVDADHAPAWSALGALQVQLGATDDGLQALERAVSLAPLASHLHNNLGYGLMLAGRHDAAAAALRRAVELDADNRRAWRNLSALYRQLEDPDRAAHAAARADGMRPATERPEPSARPSAGGPASASAGEPEASGVAATLTPLTNLEPPSARAIAPLARDASGRDANPTTALTVTTKSGSILVKIAENVYALRNGPANAAAAVAEAAAIVTAAARPAAPSALRATSPSASPSASPTTSHTASLTPSGRATTGPAPVAGAPKRPPRYEITNGHGGEGLARRLAGLLAEQGVARPRLTNHSAYDQTATFVEYREGYRDAAVAFADRLPFRPAIAPAPAGRLLVDVRLMLGRDLTTSDACAALGLCRALARPAGPVKVAGGGRALAD